MSAYFFGQQAALEKFAIEWKSPKMQAVLEGAVDKAFQRRAATGYYPTPVSAQLSPAAMERISARPESKMVRRSAISVEPPPLESVTPFDISDLGERMPVDQRIRDLAFGTKRLGLLRQPRKPSSEMVSNGSTPNRYQPTARARSRTNFEQAANWTRRGEQYGATRLQRYLNDPRMQRVLEKHVPGSVEQFRKHIAAARGQGEVPAFSMKNFPK